jgi:uncharacterized protein YprB with RNaseH-like and TPR domain
MLENTFVHLPGIGVKTERKLWLSGITTWRGLLARLNCEKPGKNATRAKKGLKESMVRIAAGDPAFFSRLLPSNLHWRLFPHFRHQSVYLDIETDGDAHVPTITTIALYDGRDILTFVNGNNLADFCDALERYTTIITYNGKCFDVPVIQRFFGIQVPHTHIDLRYVLASLGYRGGLKKCEIALNIDRGLLRGVNGFWAPLLWRQYAHHGNRRALETLLAYNVEDVVNLESLMVAAYNLKIASTPFHTSHRLLAPESPNLPFAPDYHLLEEIRRRLSASGIFFPD